MYNFHDETEKRLILRSIIESECSFSDLEPMYSNAAANTANVYCVFHEHGFHSPSAKFYWDDDKDILVLHCFRERRTFTSADYVERILIEKQGKYKTLEEFCIDWMGEKEYESLTEIYGDRIRNGYVNKLDEKIEYITNLYNKYDNVVDFINSLYLEKD